MSDLDVAQNGAGPPAAILHLEGAEAIDPGLESLELSYAAGLRSLGPVWSRPTAFGHGVPFPGAGDTRHRSGTHRAGQALVRRCAQLGIMVDVTHLNQAGFWGCGGRRRRPAGQQPHGGLRALSLAAQSHRRADRRGRRERRVVGIVYGVRFLRADLASEPDTPVSLIARHAAHVAERIGAEHVVLGSDFDGTVIPDELGDVTGVPVVLQALRTPASARRRCKGSRGGTGDGFWSGGGSGQRVGR